MDCRHTSKTYYSFVNIDCIHSEAFFIKDEVDEVIKDVLESGGDVAFVDDGLVKNYRHIALIEKE